jgi:small nuclear ribonucleoprotein (snRNP)-like protein
MQGFKKLALIVSLAWFTAFSAFAQLEVLFLNDGTILIGTLKGVSVAGAEYEAFGLTVILQPDDFYRDSATLEEIADLPVDVILTDGTLIQGTIADYDPDIGLFIEMSIGMLTLPPTSIGKIIDPARSLLYWGPDAQVRAFGGAYWPSNGLFGISATAGASIEVKVPWVRGLFAGVSLEYRFLGYQSSDDLSFALYQLTPIIGYRLLLFRTAGGFLSAFVPFASAGFGFTFVSVEDLREGVYPSSYGGLVGHIGVEAGFEIEIAEGFGATLSGRYSMVFQAGSPFGAIDVLLAASYEF